MPTATTVVTRVGRPRTGELRNCAGCGKQVYLKQSQLKKGWGYCGDCRDKLSSPSARMKGGGRVVAGFAGTFCSKCHSTLLIAHDDGLECLQCGKIIYVKLPKSFPQP